MQQSPLAAVVIMTQAKEKTGLHMLLYRVKFCLRSRVINGSQNIRLSHGRLLYITHIQPLTCLLLSQWQQSSPRLCTMAILTQTTMLYLTLTKYFFLNRNHDLSQNLYNFFVPQPNYGLVTLQTFQLSSFSLHSLIFYPSVLVSSCLNIVP